MSKCKECGATLGTGIASENDGEELCAVCYYNLEIDR